MQDLDKIYSEIITELEKKNKPKITPISRSFLGLFIALIIIFIANGLWQIKQYSAQNEFKEYMVSQANSIPISLDNGSEWDNIDENIYLFRPIILEGNYLDKIPVCIIDNIKTINGKKEICWIMAPFRLSSGGIVIINRGFIERIKNMDLPLLKPPLEKLELIGTGEATKEVGPFTAGPDIKNNIEYVQSISRIAAILNLPDEIIAPFFVKLKNGQPTALKINEAQTSINNYYLIFAIISFSLAFITFLFITIFSWLKVRQLKSIRKYSKI